MDGVCVEIGDKLDAYHDGKSSPSRLVRIVVDDVIKRRSLSRKAIAIWRKALKVDFNDAFHGIVTYCSGDMSTHQFWDWNCDTFIIGHIKDDKDTENEPIMFARRCGDFGWYGLNWNYELDLTGSIRRRNLKRWKECADEMGQTMKWNETIGEYEYFDKKTGKKVE